MDDKIRLNFQRNRVSSFLMRCPEHLGTPVNLQIWHDNSGHGSEASWFLDRVVLVDQTKKSWYMFMCEKWLSTDKSDKRLRRSLNVCSGFVLPDSSQLLRKNVAQRLSDDHIWVSVGYRANKSLFTRAQRLGVCLATLFLAMIANAMFYRDASDSAQSTTTPLISIGPFSITATHITNSLMSSLVVVPPLLLITFLFSRSSEKMKSVAIGRESQNMSGQGQRKFPHWCAYVAWALVGLCVAGAAFFTLLYAVQWGQAKSTNWLITFMLSFLESVIIIQPVKVILVAFLVSFIQKRDREFSEYEKTFGKMKEVDVTQLDYDNHFFNAAALGDELRARSDVELNERKLDIDARMKAMIREVLFYCAFLVLLLIVVNGQQNGNSYLQNNNLIQALTSPGLANQSMVNMGFFYWAQTTLLPTIFFTSHDNGRLANDEELKFMADLKNWRVGNSRIRQLRVRRDPCTNVSLYGNWSRCTKSYSYDAEDKAPYTPGWIANTSLLSIQTSSSYLNKAYTYISATEQENEAYWGQYATYSGGGYTANLGNSSNLSLAILTDLENIGWIDMYTRAVFVEFNVFNPGSGLANLVRVLLELPTNGDNFWSWRVETVQLYRYSGPGGVMALLSEILCALFALVIAVLELRAICSQRWLYVQSIWNWVQVIKLVLFFVAVALYTKRCLVTISAIDAFYNSRDKLVSFDPIIHYNSVYLLLMSLVTFLTQCQLLHVLRYNTTIAILGSTLLQSGPTLLSFSIISAILMAAYSSGAALMFNQLPDYSSVAQTMQTLLQAFVGKYNFDELYSLYGTGAASFLLSYLLLMMVVVSNFFISILNIFLDAVKEDKGLGKKDHEVVEHFLGTLGAVFSGRNGKKESKLLERIGCLDEVLTTMMATSRAMEKADAMVMFSYLLAKPAKRRL